jgi:hypothetical protein
MFSRPFHGLRSPQSNLQAELLRDCIGRLPATISELCQSASCADGDKLRRLRRYMQIRKPTGSSTCYDACPFCATGFKGEHTVL